MNSIVHRAVGDVAENKPGKERERIPAYNGVKKVKKQECQQQAGYRGHKESVPVARVFVVHAMHYIHKSLCTRAICYNVKNIAVHDVLKKAPEDNASGKKKRFRSGRDIFLMPAVVQQEADNGEINSINDEWMGFSHHLHKVIAEEPCLSFIFDFLEFHNRDSKRKKIQLLY